MRVPHRAFRQSAVHLARTGDNVAVLAKECRFPTYLPNCWRKPTPRTAESKRLSSAEKKELAELRRRSRQPEMEVDP